jgi:hypothetical protein
MNAPRCRQLRDDTSANTQAALQREWGTSVQALKMTTANGNLYSSAAYPYGVMNSMAALEIFLSNSQSKNGAVLNFKWLSQNGGRTDFSENLRVSLLIDDLSNEPTFSQSHLDGQYL